MWYNSSRAKCEGALPPLHSPRCRRSALHLEFFAGLVVPAPNCRRSALHPGDFPVAGKVTKGAPRAAPFGIPRCRVTALFALAALRSVSRRAIFSHNKRSICHFGLVGKRALFSPQALPGKHFLLSIRGAAGILFTDKLPGVAPLSGGSGACRRWGDDNAPQGGSGGLPPDTPLPTFIVK